MATINKRSNRDYVRHLETIEKLLEEGGGGGGTPNAVKYTPQSLTSSQQQQARTNIGSASASELSQKQDTLVSGTNIKTLNNQSLLGSGNITIDDQSAVKYTDAQSLSNAQKATARGNIAAASLADINNTQYVKAAIRPEPSENTVGPIYLIGPDANDEYERYFTQESNGTYTWVALGSTEIHMDGYATDQDIEDVNDEISHLEAKVDNVAEEGEDIELTLYYPAYSIFGSCINNGVIDNTRGRRTLPIPVLAGDVVTAIRGVGDNDTAQHSIYATDKNGTYYTLLVTSIAGRASLEYTVEEDGYIVVTSTAGSGGLTPDFRVKIVRNYESVKSTETSFIEPSYTPSTYVSSVNHAAAPDIIGNTPTSTSYKLSDYVDIRDFTYISLSVVANKINSIAGTVFYDAQQNPVGAINCSTYTGPFTEKNILLLNIIRPGNVAYVRFSLFADMTGYSQQYELDGYVLEKVYGDGLVQKVQKLQEDLDADVETLQSQIDDLDADVETLQSQIDDLDADVENLAARGMARFSESLELGEDIYIIAARDNNLLRYGTENGVDYLYLSKDLGATWTKKQNTYGGLTYAYFFTDGTLMFCSEQAVYHTKDMVTVEQATVYDYDGSTSVPSGHRFFSHTVADKPTYINGVEWVLFYDYVLGTTPNPRIWYSNDNGQTVHAAFAFGLSTINGVAISARHPHGFKYNEYDGYFYAWTGDSESECRIMRGTYSSGVWSWEVLKTGVEYKLGKMWFDAGNFYAVTDFTDGSMANEKGFLKCPISDIDSDNYYHLFRATAQTMGNGSLTNYFADKHGWRVVLPDNQGGNRTWIAKDDFAFIVKANSRAVRLNAFFGPDAAGNIYCRYATYSTGVQENQLFITSPTINLTQAMRNSGAVDFMDYNDYDFK